MAIVKHVELNDLGKMGPDAFATKAKMTVELYFSSNNEEVERLLKGIQTVGAVNLSNVDTEHKQEQDEEVSVQNKEVSEIEDHW